MATQLELTNAALAQQISNLVNRWNTRENEMVALLSQPEGTVDVHDGVGNVHTLPSYPALIKSVGELLSDGTGAVDAAAASASLASQMAVVATNEAQAAETQAVEAANQASAAAVSASDSEAAKVTAEAVKPIVAQSASDAAESATQAQNSADSSQGFADASATSALVANDSAAAALASQNRAQEWAENAYGDEVEPGRYSARHWADTAATTVSGAFVFRGRWDASSGVYPSASTSGWFWVVAVAGTIAGTAWGVGDQMVWNGTTWDRIPNQQTVHSVNGLLGDVVIDVDDLESAGSLAVKDAADWQTDILNIPTEFPPEPHEHTKDEVGLSNVDNTSDADKPVSIAQGAAIEQAVNAARVGRNLLINGNFDIWQRGTSFNNTNYHADRWQTGAVGSTSVTSRQAFADGQTAVPNNPTNHLRCVVSSSAGANNFVSVTQKVESIRSLSGRVVTASFWAKASAPRSIGVTMRQDFGTGGSPSAQATMAGQKIAISTAWAKYTATFTVPGIAGNSVGTATDGWVGLVFYLDAGSNSNAQSGSLGQQSGTFDIAQVQLEAGPLATPFDSRPIGVELELCQRYYEKSYNLDVFPGAAPGGGGRSAHFNSATGLGLTVTVPYAVTKRAPPAVTVYANTTGAAGNVTQDDGSNVAVSSLTSGMSTLEVAFSNGPGRFGGRFHWTSDAEL